MGLSAQHKIELVKQAGLDPIQAHRVNGNTPEDFLEDAQKVAEILDHARAMFRQHEQERKLLDERQYQAVEAALKSAQDSPWLSTAGCSRYLGVSENSIHAYSGPHVHGPDRLPFHRTGGNGSKRFHKDDIDAWLRRHEG